MNIVISGPFGRGSLCDEIALAGLLKPLRAAHHTVTILSANADATKAMHGVAGVTLASPGALMSTPDAWGAVEKAHLFLLAGAGVISDRGKTPARSWLAQLEQIKPLKRTTGIIGAGAIAIDDRREEVRVQRFLHHFCDGLTTRDEASKTVLLEYGLGAVRISNTGDPTLALADFGVPKAPEKTAPAPSLRAAFFFADGVPLRQTFEPEPTVAPSGLARGLNGALKALHERQFQATVFHDASRQNERLAHALAEGVPSEAIDFATPADAMHTLVTKMKRCTLALTDTLHGLLFAAVNNVPAIFCADGSYATEMLQKLGLADLAVPLNSGDLDAAKVAAAADTLLPHLIERKNALHVAVLTLARREAQNARLIERLVPRRDRYDRGPRDRVERAENSEGEPGERAGKKKKNKQRIEYY